MPHSETIGELTTALSLAQGEMAPAAKDAQNPHFQSKYADLASIWKACRGPLSKHGLAVIQVLGNPGGAAVTITTILSHKSNEWVSGDYTVPVAQQSAQAFGSAVTYARRQSLAAMVGIAPDDDDDGEAADPRNAPRGAVRTMPPPRRPAPVPLEPVAPAAEPLPWTKHGDMVTDFQLRGSVVGQSTYTSVLQAHGIPVNFKWAPDKRPPRLMEAFHALSAMADENAIARSGMVPTTEKS